MNILEELDFKNWKLPVEPQQLIMLYLAYKMINKLDTNPFINPPMPRPVVKSVNPSSGIFLIVFFVFRFIKSIIKCQLNLFFGDILER